MHKHPLSYFSSHQVHVPPRLTDFKQLDRPTRISNCVFVPATTCDFALITEIGTSWYASFDCWLIDVIAVCASACKGYKENQGGH
jgi:hypothetical protein